MNKNMMKKRWNYLNIGMLFSMLIFLSGSSFIGNALSTEVMPISHSFSADTTYTPTATPTSTFTPTSIFTLTPYLPSVALAPTITPTPTPTPTPTDTPTPTPTPTRSPTPTPIPPTPTPRPFIPPPPIPTPTDTPTPTATATPTAVPIDPTATPDDTLQNIKNTQINNPGAGGPSPLMLSLGISTPILLLFGGGLFWLYARRNQQSLAEQESDPLAFSPWMNNSDLAVNNAFPQAAEAFPSATPYYAPDSYFDPNAQNIPGTNMPQQSSLLPPAELAELLHRPSDPLSMGSAEQASNQQAPDLNPYPATSNMPENLNPMREMNPSTATPMSAAPGNLPVQPPDIAGDPMLENVMRQAQLGLFVTPGHQTS